MGCGASSTSDEFRTFPKQEEQHSYIRKASPNDQRNGSATSAAKHQRNGSTNSAAKQQRNGSANSAAKHQRNGSAKQDARGAPSQSRVSSAASTASKRKKKSLVERSSSYASLGESQNANKDTVVRKESAGSQRSTSSAQRKRDENRAKRESERANLVPLNDANAGGHVQNKTDVNETKGPHAGLSKDAKHEARAKLIEERRSKVDMDKDEAKILEKYGVPAIDVPDHAGTTDHTEYTIDGIVDHNTEVGTKDWFKYGHRVYSAELMLPCIRDRMTEFKQKHYPDEEFPLFILGGYHNEDDRRRGNPESEVMSLKRGWPVFTARYYGVTRPELKKVLAVCLIGKVVDVEREILLERLKQSVENTLEALDEQDASGYVTDSRDQLNRWLEDYPSVQVYNDIPQAGIDPNEQPFPLPKPILFDPLILRRWVEEYKLLDTEVAEDGAWSRKELLNEDYGDAHETFAALVKSHVDESLPDLDMSIDGEAAWNVIEIDLLKNDTTTDGQETIWTCRAKRTNITDPEWMTKRRDEIAASFIARHEMDPNVMSPYLSFCKNMEDAWKQFQALVEDNFIPPKRTAPDTSRMKERQLKSRQKSLDSIASSIISGTGNVHGDSIGQPIQASNEDIHANDNVDNNEKSNTNAEEEEQTNAFLTLPDDDDDNSPKTLGNGDATNEPMVLETASMGDDTSQLNSATSGGDQVDDNRTAVDMEASGIQTRGSSPGVEATPDAAPPSAPKTPDQGQNKPSDNDNNHETSISETTYVDTSVAVSGVSQDQEDLMIDQ